MNNSNDNDDHYCYVCSLFWAQVPVLSNFDELSMAA